MEAPHAPRADAGGRPAGTLPERYQRIRAFTETLCETLETEDYVLQSMTEASPTRWHLAHTTWFFETFVLRPHAKRYESPDDRYNYLFNSYYNAIGEQFARPDRGLLSRPTVSEAYDYRRHVDEHMAQLFAGGDIEEIAGLVEVGLNHEQQHQELMLTDLKHALSLNPLRPVYREQAPRSGAAGNMDWIAHEEGIRTIGHEGEGFAYDNEGPNHRVFLEPHRIASRLVTNAEYMEFIRDGGYATSLHWLDMGWATVNEQGWKAPIYWEERDGQWWHFTLSGMVPIALEEPLVHISYYEAEAFARWAGRRLPTEFEWEAAAAGQPVEGNFVDSGAFHPVVRAGVRGQGREAQFFGDVWEWTMSHYSPYPGYRPSAGAIGEYNGKWMCNQFVLRGGSCASPRDHIRGTYRNFFHPDARWQFAGIRLADDS